MLVLTARRFFGGGAELAAFKLSDGLLRSTARAHIDLHAVGPEHRNRVRAEAGTQHDAGPTALDLLRRLAGSSHVVALVHNHSHLS